MYIDTEIIKTKINKRPIDANKGTFGSVLIIAGSKNFPGAAILSVLACYRVGTGLVILATSSEVYKVIVPKIPFATFLDFSEIKNNVSKYNSILIGPGLSQSEEVKNLISALIDAGKLVDIKLVLDADCLNILSKERGWFNQIGDAILTPHPGEMSRLTDLSINEIQNNREEIAKKFAKLWNKTIVLKGAETVITNPKGGIFISTFKNPLLATAGTGDVLAGMMAGFLAQGLSLTDAAIAGVYIHGLAGEKLKEKFGDCGATALDLVETLPEVFKDLRSS